MEQPSSLDVSALPQVPKSNGLGGEGGHVSGSGEGQPDKNSEAGALPPEALGPASRLVGSAPPPMVMSVQQSAQVSDDSTNKSVSKKNPSAADEVDVIEKEWVDRAKQIVAETKSDPYAQEKNISKLQADYLKKRYGRELRVTED